MAAAMTRRSLLSSALAAAAFPASPGFAQSEDGIALTDDFSRGEIFQQFVVDPFEVDNASQTRTLAIPASFQFPRDVINDCTVDAHHRCVADPSKQRSKDVMFGIDINHYTNSDEFSFDQIRDQHVSFVQMKTSQGSGYRDEKFPLFWKQAGQLAGSRKIYRGPYHFLTASADGKAQADWFLKLLDRDGRAGAFRVEVGWRPRL